MTLEDFEAPLEELITRGIAEEVLRPLLEAIKKERYRREASAYSPYRYPEWRCTLPLRYCEGSPGHSKSGPRNGHYIRAPSADVAKHILMMQYPADEIEVDPGPFRGPHPRLVVVGEVS